MYDDLTFPDPPPDRPYTFINMVTTIDGKILTGDRNEHVMDLGSKTDHAVMRQIEATADAVVIGGGTLRATPKLHFDCRLIRIVVSNDSGISELPSGETRRFFSDCPEKAYVATYETFPLPDGVVRLSGNLKEMAGQLRHLGVRRLLCEGGSELNASMIRAGLVDELFLTLAPKVKLGRDVPTYAGGSPLDRLEVLNFTLIETHVVENEVFLRYRKVNSG